MVQWKSRKSLAVQSFLRQNDAAGRGRTGQPRESVNGTCGSCMPLRSLHFSLQKLEGQFEAGEGLSRTQRALTRSNGRSLDVGKVLEKRTKSQAVALSSQGSGQSWTKPHSHPDPLRVVGEWS